MEKIKVALIGLGNCASALLQGINYYKDHSAEGVMTSSVGNYTASDIEVVTAFDLNTNKVGKPIEEAVWQKPNNAYVFSNVDNTNLVQAGVQLDSMATYHHHQFDIVSQAGTRQSVIQTLQSTGAQIAVCYLPVGSAEASRFYAECCLEAGTSLINAMPEFITTDEEWNQRFAEAQLVCAGDDVKSQVGATVVHRTLAHLIEMRGQKINNTYQLNFGGNTDFENMLDRSRLATKEQSKTQAVTSLLSDLPQMKVGPSDFVHYLDDKKICYINIQGEQFGGAPFRLELKLEVEDSPNSAGVICDAIRGVKVAMERGQYGYCHPVSSWCFKSPSRQVPDLQAKEIFENWIAEK